MKFNASQYNQHWQNKTLNDLGKFQRGRSRHRPRNDHILFVNGIHPLIQTGEIKEANLFITQHNSAYNDLGLAQSKLWPKHTLCITIAANIAETALLSYPMCFPDSVVGFNANSEESSELFMHYVFTYIKRAIQNSATGSIQDNINIDYLTNLEFKIPFKEYQDKIVAILSALDTKIECNNRINAELEAMARTLYNYWFLQFDFPDKNGKPYKSSGGKMIFNDVLQRDIPLEWKIVTLSDIANIIMGQSPPGKSYNANGHGIVFYQGCTDFAMRFPTVRQYTTAPTRFAKKDDILLSVRAPVGSINIANNDCCIGRGIAALNSKDNCISYLLWVINDLKKIFSRRNNEGTTFGAITKNDLFSLNVVSPPRPIIDSFKNLANPIFEKQNLCALENQKLAALRDWLLPLLMSGQIRVMNEKK